MSENVTNTVVLDKKYMTRRGARKAAKKMQEESYAGGLVQYRVVKSGSRWGSWQIKSVAK